MRAMTPRGRDRSRAGAGISSHESLLESLLAELDAAASPSARLSARQTQELDELRDEIARLCRRGEIERARRAAAMAVAIARKGRRD